MKKNEILIYMAIAFCVLFISGYVVISNLISDSNDSSSKDETYSANGAKKPNQRKKRKWKNYASKTRYQKEFIPEGVDIDTINASLLNVICEFMPLKHQTVSKRLSFP